MLSFGKYPDLSMSELLVVHGQIRFLVPAAPTEARVVALDSSFRDLSSYTSFRDFRGAGDSVARDFVCGNYISELRYGCEIVLQRWMWHGYMCLLADLLMLELEDDAGIRITPPDEAAEEQIKLPRDDQYDKTKQIYDIHRAFRISTLLATRAWLRTYGPFNPYIPIRSTIIGKSRVAIDLIAMHTSWRSNSDIASVTSIGYPRMSASGESSTMMHRLLHASGSHPIPTPYDPKTNQYNQYLGLIHSTNGNHLESPNEGSSIDHQVTIYLHAQNITMFPTNETWYFASQILLTISGGLILILTAQSTRNMFRIHSDY
ncbi:hypothetical protein F511_06428 [Dorcoceras hygrometricum]|uniref:Uncharacterized protein n=1 Tax=Dorcoceras hygrometricum TaxID=472368 RepID=A0A2Z7C6J6_9LAMI|nr:hypothetical protein F511_06428 [Dorcoceras hygrometricum]